ncbi:GNAT family N-acetyltransferase [Vibrio lentus]|nr:GNAT family N-acetyltransferase [Vibrio lentus]
MCFKPYDNAYHVHLLIISHQYQDQSLGKKSCHASTKKLQSRVTTKPSHSVEFRSNTRAISFYQALGYQIVDDSDEDCRDDSQSS